MEVVILGNNAEVKPLQSLIETLNSDSSYQTLVVVTPSYFKQYSTDRNNNIRKYLKTVDTVVITIGTSDYNLNFASPRISSWELANVSRYTDKEKITNSNSGYTYHADSNGIFGLFKNNSLSFLKNVVDVNLAFAINTQYLINKESIVSEGSKLLFEAIPSYYSSKNDRIICHSVVSKTSRNNNYHYLTLASSLTCENIVDIVNYIKTL